MLLLQYKTVKCYGEHEINIERSRFICYITRATSEDEAQNFIASIKKKHWDATHNCSAYMIGQHNGIQKANDDGEPSGTAGVPMLEVLKKRQLHDTVVVVTRYFGGIKLGAGGLIRAYGKSVSEGINHTGIVVRKKMTCMDVTVDYSWTGKIENELRNSDYLLRDTTYLENVTYSIWVESNTIPMFEQWVIEISNGRAHIEEKETTYLEVDIQDVTDDN